MILVAWGVAGALAGREWKHPIYPIEANVEGVDPASFLESLEGRWTVRWVDADGGEVPRHARDLDVLLEVIKLLASNRAGVYGGDYNLEYEVRVNGVPVQLRLDEDQEVLDVRVGREPFAFVPERAPADLAAAMGASVVTGPFTQLELDTLWWAWGLLTPAERMTLAGAEYIKLEGRIPRRLEGATVQHRYRSPHLRVMFSPGSMTHEMWGEAMVGAIGRVHHLGQETIVHELGHAVGYGQFRLGAERRLAASGSERRRHRRCARDGYWESPVDEAFMEAAGGLWSPSDYGIDDIGEAFAEAFAFWKLHPDWLQEMKPAVYDWFAADGHLAWMDDPGCGLVVSTPP